MKSKPEIEMLIEASLFSAGRPLSIKELNEALDLPKENIQKGLKKLRTIYSIKDGALEIAKVGNKYSMQVKPDLAEYIRTLAQMEIPVKVLKTAALIAYHQPIRQSELQEMFGAKVYDHVKVLLDKGLISKRAQDRTIILTTTAQFAEYFGIDTTDREKIKQRLIDKVKKVEQTNFFQKKKEE